MVIDWISHINKCVDESKLIYSFHATQMEKHYQQILIVKKLLLLNYTEEEILDWFLKVEERSEKSLWDIENLIYTANRTRWPHNRKYKIYITQEEIDYINKLEATKECKSFLLATVAFCKMMMIKRKKPTFNIRERSYIYYLATGKDEFNIGARRGPYIEAFIRKLEKDKIIKRKVQITSIKKKTGKRGGSISDIADIVLNAPWVDWKSKKGIEIVDVENQISELCNQVFEEEKFICIKCGQEFIGNRKTKKAMCDKCYKEDLKERKTKSRKEIYNDKTWFVFKHINSITGESFISIDDSKHGDRWKDKEWFKNQVILQRAIVIYGWRNFKHTILEAGIESKEEAFEKEREYIEKERTYIGYKDCNGYNMKKEKNMQIKNETWTYDDIMKLAAVFKEDYGGDRSARKKKLEEEFLDQKYLNLMKKARELGLTEK